MGIRFATILFADIIGCSEISNNTNIKTYNDILEQFQEAAIKVEKILFPSTIYTEEELEFSLKGDEVCIILHSAHDVSTDKEPYEEHKLLYQKDIEMAILFALSLKLKWLVSEYNMDRIENSLLPRELGIGINHGPVWFSTHPATGRKKSSEGYSINLAKRIEGESRNGVFSKALVSNEVFHLADQNCKIVKFAGDCPIHS